MRRPLLVLALAAASLGMTACAAPAASGPLPSRAVPAIRISGHPVPYDRQQQWTAASISSRASRELDVFATGSTTSGGDVCGPPVLRFRVQETAELVRILVLDYEARSGPETSCSLIGYLPSPHPMRLANPLGDRRLVDASTGKAVEVLDGSQHPDLPHPPSGVRAAVLSQRAPEQPVVRRWLPLHGDGFPVVSIEDQPPASASISGRVARQTDVHGTPATVYQGVGAAPGSWFVQWTPNPRQTITVQVSAGAAHRWDAASALALARSITGYRTEQTGRIGQPDVPGTVAATYNSADGPVTDVQNLLKSSGVYVGLDCVGAGRLTVTIRGRATTFTCGAALAHHEYETEGRSFDAFRLSVAASAGVRWSLSLARASLDGS